jgi:cyclase
MRRSRVIPTLLILGDGLVKTRRFKDPVYIGDPINATRIFSEKEADEIVVLDILAARERGEPNYDLVCAMAGEAFMPLAFGGGVRSVEQVRRLIRAGVEKVIVNTAAAQSGALIAEIASEFGSQAVVGAIDVKRSLFGKPHVMVQSGTIGRAISPVEQAELLCESGAGEILLTSIDRDGLMCGLDIPLIKSVAAAVPVPVIASGGAGAVEHLRAAIREGGAEAVAAGSMFVFHGRHRAVLINYPTGLVI